MKVSSRAEHMLVLWIFLVVEAVAHHLLTSEKHQAALAIKIKFDSAARLFESGI